MGGEAACGRWMVLWGCCAFTDGWWRGCPLAPTCVSRQDVKWARSAACDCRWIGRVRWIARVRLSNGLKCGGRKLLASVLQDASPSLRPASILSLAISLWKGLEPQGCLIDLATTAACLANTLHRIRSQQSCLHAAALTALRAAGDGSASTQLIRCHPSSPASPKSSGQRRASGCRTTCPCRRHPLI